MRATFATSHVSHVIMYVLSFSIFYFISFCTYIRVIQPVYRDLL